MIFPWDKNDEGLKRGQEAFGSGGGERRNAGMVKCPKHGRLICDECPGFSGNPSPKENADGEKTFIVTYKPILADKERFGVFHTQERTETERIAAASAYDARKRFSETTHGEVVSVVEERQNDGGAGGGAGAGGAASGGNISSASTGYQSAEKSTTAHREEEEEEGESMGHREQGMAPEQGEPWDQELYRDRDQPTIDQRERCNEGERQNAGHVAAEMWAVASSEERGGWLIEARQDVELAARPWHDLSIDVQKALQDAWDMPTSINNASGCEEKRNAEEKGLNRDKHEACSNCGFVYDPSVDYDAQGRCPDCQSGGEKKNAGPVPTPLEIAASITKKEGKDRAEAKRLLTGAFPEASIADIEAALEKFHSSLLKNADGEQGDIEEIERHVEGIEHELGEMKEEEMLENDGFVCSACHQPGKKSDMKMDDKPVCTKCAKDTEKQLGNAADGLKCEDCGTPLTPETAAAVDNNRAGKALCEKCYHKRGMWHGSDAVCPKCGERRNELPLGGSTCPDCQRGKLRSIVGEDHRFKCDVCKTTFRDDVETGPDGKPKRVENRDISRSEVGEEIAHHIKDKGMEPKQAEAAAFAESRRHSMNNAAGRECPSCGSKNTKPWGPSDPSMKDSLVCGNCNRTFYDTDSGYHPQSSEHARFMEKRNAGDDLYSKLKATGAKMDSHESDLYVEATPQTESIVRSSGHSFSFFTSNIDGKRWIDVPFAYQPFWDKRAERHNANGACDACGKEAELRTLPMRGSGTAADSWHGGSGNPNLCRKCFDKRKGPGESWGEDREFLRRISRRADEADAV
jgi:transposase-like protein